MEFFPAAELLVYRMGQPERAKGSIAMTHLVNLILKSG
jgi:hypothetical protein